MGLARLCLRNGALLRGRLSPGYLSAFAAAGGGATMGHPLDLRPRSAAAAAAAAAAGEGGGGAAMPWNCSFSSSFCSGAATQADDAASKVPAAAEKREVAATSSRQRGRQGRSWRSPWDLVPFRLNTDGLGNALMQVSENLNRVLQNWMPSRLLGRMKEDDSCYKLRFEVPGLSKEDIRITVEDGMLVVRGERKEEDAFEEDEDQCGGGGGGGWCLQRYGFYNTSLLLPDDAEVEHIKAEVKNGLLYVTIPRSAEKKRHVTEVKIQ